MSFIAVSYASATINYAYINPKRIMNLSDFYGDNMINDDSILDKKAPSSIITPISFMDSRMMAYKVFSELTGFGTIKDVIKIDLLTWEVYNLKLLKIFPKNFINLILGRSVLNIADSFYMVAVTIALVEVYNIEASTLT